MRDMKRECKAPHCHMCEMDDLRERNREVRQLAQDMLVVLEDQVNVHGLPVEALVAPLRRRAGELGFKIYRYIPSTD